MREIKDFGFSKISKNLENLEFLEISKVAAWCRQATGIAGMVICILGLFFKEISNF